MLNSFLEQIIQSPFPVSRFTPSKVIDDENALDVWLESIKTPEEKAEAVASLIIRPFLSRLNVTILQMRLVNYLTTYYRLQCSQCSGNTGPDLTAYKQAMREMQINRVKNGAIHFKSAFDKWQAEKNKVDIYYQKNPPDLVLQTLCVINIINKARAYTETFITEQEDIQNLRNAIETFLDEKLHTSVLDDFDILMSNKLNEIKKLHESLIIMRAKSHENIDESPLYYKTKMKEHWGFFDSGTMNNLLQRS